MCPVHPKVTLHARRHPTDRPSYQVSALAISDVNEKKERCKGFVIRHGVEGAMGGYNVVCVEKESRGSIHEVCANQLQM